MAAKPKKPGASTQSSTAKTTTKTTPSSASPPTSNHSNQPKDEQLGPAGAGVSSGRSDHRSSQPFPGAAPLRQVQQSPNVNNGHSSNQQQQYPVQGVFSPRTGLQSPYLNNPAQFQQQHAPAENQYYTSNPSPRSTNSATYYSSDKPESMAATATMQRPYPPIYHTPQSNSPASVTSPQTHDHGRPMYPQQPPQLQPLYGYPTSYQSMNQVHSSAYGNHQQSPMHTQSMLQYPSNANQMTHPHMSNQQQSIASSPRVKSDQQQYSQTSQPPLMRQHSTAGTPSNPGLQSSQQTGPSSASNAAPGPIPATTPLVVRQDNNGVQWIAFEYSRDRVKMEYTIRCDVESVDANNLSQEFKSENCVYPRACVPKEQYKGNRLAYETDCNQVGWALAELNVCLRGKRGLIQRAVDSWRNSNQDPRLRSRRVRRQAKLNSRSRTGASSQAPGPNGPVSAGVPGSSMAAPSTRPGGNMPTSNQQPMHHHTQHEVSPTGQESVGASSYSTTPSMHRPSSTSQHLSSPNDLRHSQTFPGYQPYPTVPTTLGPPMAPPIQGMNPYGRPSHNSTMASSERAEEDAELFGELPEGKRRKFILVEDIQKHNRVRVKVTLDQVAPSEMPDSYRKHNSVFPRAYFPVQMQTSSESVAGGRYAEEDVEDVDDAPPTVGRMSVACQMSEGDGEVYVPQLTQQKRNRERKLNELGHRMAWGQSRVFSGRPIFLARALDAYRNKQRTALISAGQDVTTIPPHLETRPGKRRWHERTRSGSHPASPPAPSSI